MKIAQVTEYFAPWAGGISEHVRCLSQELRALGHDVRTRLARDRSRAIAASVVGDHHVDRVH